MTEKGFEFDVITDYDLHLEGVQLLKHYNVAVQDRIQNIIQVLCLMLLRLIKIRRKVYVYGC